MSIFTSSRKCVSCFEDIALFVILFLSLFISLKTWFIISYFLLIPFIVLSLPFFLFSNWIYRFITFLFFVYCFSFPSWIRIYNFITAVSLPFYLISFLSLDAWFTGFILFFTIAFPLLYLFLFFPFLVIEFILIICFSIPLLLLLSFSVYKFKHFFCFLIPFHSSSFLSLVYKFMLILSSHSFQCYNQWDFSRSIYVMISVVSWDI